MTNAEWVAQLEAELYDANNRVEKLLAERDEAQARLARAEALLREAAAFLPMLRADFPKVGKIVRGIDAFLRHPQGGIPIEQQPDPTWEAFREGAGR